MASSRVAFRTCLFIFYCAVDHTEQLQGSLHCFLHYIHGGNTETLVEIAKKQREKYTGSVLTMRHSVQPAYISAFFRARKTLLARAEADHHFRMRVQKCIDFAEHLQLAESEGYSFTEAQLNEAKEWVD